MRLETYALRIATFIRNPLLGDYAGSNMLLRIGYLFWGFDIPSHSDILDILAFFGIVGALIYFYPVLLVFFRSKLNSSDDVFYLFILLGFVFLMAFNPVINQPKIIVIYYYVLALSYERFKLKFKI